MNKQNESPEKRLNEVGKNNETKESESDTTSSSSESEGSDPFEDEQHEIKRLKKDTNKLWNKKRIDVPYMRPTAEIIPCKQAAIIHGFGVQERELSAFLQRFHKEIVPKNLAQRDRLLWLQEYRNNGVWAQCIECKKWRHLHKVTDALEVSKYWTCDQNKDYDFRDCKIAQSRTFIESDLIDAIYSPGSIVLARIQGFPWWPAIVDDDPIYEQYFWLEKNSNKAIFYHVVFFDAQRKITRGWVDLDNIKPFNEMVLSTSGITQLNSYNYKNRLTIARQQAVNAMHFKTPERLSNYSFISRYKGPLVKRRSLLDFGELKNGELPPLLDFV